jgi:hypothetical protein
MALDTLTIPNRRVLPLTLLIGLISILFPAALLSLVLWLEPGNQANALACGVGTLVIIAAFLVRENGLSHVMLRRSIIALYLIALAWHWICRGDSHTKLSYLITGVLLLIPLCLMVFQELNSSATASNRRARLLVHRLAHRRDWPEQLADCRNLPDALALREALQEDPTPALTLLDHPDPRPRLCALSALQYRRKWKRAHAQFVIQTAQASMEPIVRSTALTALATVTDPILINAIAQYLRDPSPDVRRAAAGALLWKPEKRWPVLRLPLRSALGDPRCARDGALPCLTPLPEIALNDLTIWAGEIGAVGQRATMTLIGYYRRMINEDSSSELIDHLQRQMFIDSVPSAVRVEIAYLLSEHHLLHQQQLERLMEPNQPGPLQLLAIEAILKEKQDERAIELLREIAKQPNRVLALAAAGVVQKCLQIDLGMPLGNPPAANTREAAEIIRRLMRWATRKVYVPGDDDTAIDFDRIHEEEKQSQVENHDVSWLMKHSS